MKQSITEIKRLIAKYKKEQKALEKKENEFQRRYKKLFPIPEFEKWSCKPVKI